MSRDLRKTFKRDGSCVCFLHIKSHINIGVAGVMRETKGTGSREDVCALCSA